MAERLQRSVGWLSQVERDKSVPDMNDLQELSKVYEVPLSLFFGSASARPGEEGRIVRADARRRIGTSEKGLLEELLSPDLTDSFEVIHSTFQPGAERLTLAPRPTQELGCVISGQLEVWLDEAKFLVGEGDSFRIREQSFRWRNPFEQPAVVIWVISPPVY